MNAGRISLWAAASLAGFCALRRWTHSRRWLDLRDKVVLITGGSRGLGLVLAREFIAGHARVAICARDDAEVGRAEADLAQRGGNVFAFPCDITRREQIEQLVRSVRQRFGPIDVLVNNAGVIQVGPIEVMTQADFEESMLTHFWGPLWTILEVLPDMRRRRAGRIVNISSIGGKLSVPHLLPYGASKFALTGLSEGLRAELAKDEIYVTTVCPGLMRTGGAVNATFKGQHRAEFAWFSISDALPGISIDARRAARRIIAGCQRGEAEVIVSVPAKLAALFHGLCPETAADLLGLAHRLLPAPGGIGSARALGHQSTSVVTPSWLTTLSDRAARRNNQFTDNQ